MAIYKEDIVDIELESGSIHRSFLNHTIGTGDNAANWFGVRVFRHGAAETLTNVSVQGYFRDPQGNNIAITSGNSVSGNVAKVCLPQACYNYEGQFCLAIKLVGGGVTGTVRIVDGMVDNTNTGGAVAPTESVPTYQEILAVYDEMLEAVTDYDNVVAEQNGLIADIDGAVNHSGIDYSRSDTVSVPLSQGYLFPFPGFMIPGQRVHLECSASGVQFILYKMLSKDGEDREAISGYVTEATWDYEATEDEKVLGFQIWVSSAVSGAEFEYSYSITNQWSRETQRNSYALTENNVFDEEIENAQGNHDYDFMFVKPLRKNQDLHIDTSITNGTYNVYKITGTNPNDPNSRVKIADLVSEYKATLTPANDDEIYGIRIYTTNIPADTDLNVSIVSNGIFTELSRLSEEVNSNKKTADRAYDYEDSDQEISETIDDVEKYKSYDWFFEHPIRKGQLLNIKLDISDGHMIVYKIIGETAGDRIAIASYVRKFEKTITSTDDETIYGIMIYIANKFSENVSMNVNFSAPSITTWIKNGTTIVPRTEIEPVLANLIYDYNVDNQQYEFKPFAVVHFSDVHGSTEAIQRIIDFSNEYSEYLNDVIHTGDAAQSTWESGYDSIWYDQTVKPLQVMGNHDVWTDGTSGLQSWHTGYSAKQCYTRYIAPIASSISAVTNKAYWSKTYANEKIMLIAIDNYHWKETIYNRSGEAVSQYPNGDSKDNGEQLTWFVNTLNSAKANGYGVIALSHEPAIADTHRCSFTSLINEPIEGICAEALQAVQSFIEGGGEFITWLCGHTHYDYIGEISEYPDQPIVVIDSSRPTEKDSQENWIETMRVKGTRSENLFNIFSVDRNKKFISLFRVGMEYDKFGRHIGSLVYDYDNKEVIWNS